MIDVIKYDTEKYNFRKYFEDCLGKLEDIHLNHRIEDIGESTAGGVVFDKSRDSTYYGLIERLFREVVHGPYTFRYTWWEFQKEVIKPWFLGDAVLHDGAIVIQKLPCEDYLLCLHIARHVDKIVNTWQNKELETEGQLSEDLELVKKN